MKPKAIRSILALALLVGLVLAAAPVALTAGTAYAVPAPPDINGGVSWNGWVYRGQSNALGVYSKGSNGTVWKIYTTEFVYDSVNTAIAGGAHGGFVNGDKILGIGIERVSGTGEYAVVGFDLDNADFTPSTTTVTPGNGHSNFPYQDDGDPIIHFPMPQYGGQPSVVTVVDVDGSGNFIPPGLSVTPCGPFGCGTFPSGGLPGIRGQSATAGKSQMFFDLTYMPTYYTFLGAIQNNISFWINIDGTEAVARSSPELPCSTACYVDAVTGSDMNPGTLASPFRTIQKGVASVDVGGTVNVAAGTYNEGIAINKNNLTITGAGAATTSIVGPKSGGSDTVLFSASGGTLQGFTITRDGNNPTDWSANTRNQGVNFTGSGNTLQNCVLTGNRNAILLASAGQFVLNNTIDNNRTGIHVNEGGNTTIRGNLITNNWTIGILFRQYVGAPGFVITDNTITGNWYAQVEDRGNPEGIVRNIQGNWFGPGPFTIVQASTAGEPGYTSQIPAEFPGGSATPPASTPTFVVNPGPSPSAPPDNGGNGNANVIRLAYSPWLSTGANSVLAGTPGFQGDFSKLSVDAVSAQFGGTAIQRGIDMVSGSTVIVAPGTYTENVNVNKALKLRGSAGGGFSAPVATSATAAPGVWYTDRYAPAVFESYNFGGEMVLRHGVRVADSAANRPSAYSGPFYNTQGRKLDTNLAGSQQSMSIDLWLDAAMSGPDCRVAGLWATGMDSSNGIQSYPIVAFRNSAKIPDFLPLRQGSMDMISTLPAGGFS